MILLSSLGFLLILKELDELHIASMNKKLEKNNQLLEEMNSAKNTFFSIISHDLRGPISALVGVSEILTDKKNAITEKDREALIDIIYSSTTKTYDLLNNLLQWANAESGHMPFNPAIINVRKVIDETILILSTNSHAKSITITNYIDKNEKIFADLEMFHIIIRNLISNAIKFTPEHGTIDIGITSREKKLVTLYIKDSGIGIKKEDLESLLNIDSKVKERGTNNEQGSGLGLKLCKQFVKKNNGQIRIESEQNKGSTFFITLPINP